MNQTEKPQGTRQSETEIAYAVLKQRKDPLHYKELVEAVFAAQPLKPEESRQRVIASILTQINLDNRFFHFGGGLWGLREWAPKQRTSRVPLLSPLHKRQREAPDEHDEEDENDLEQGFIINDFEYGESEEEEYEE